MIIPIYSDLKSRTIVNLDYFAVHKSKQTVEKSTPTQGFFMPWKRK